ncbi:cation transporter [Methylorubrum extorquens]|uniref:cation transporter n=1 Tax=Methylorubrum extorquens TaxID=408 RepID=UPI0009D68F35
MTERPDHSGHVHGGHAHGPGHVHAPANFDRAFAIGVGLNTLYVALEATFGILSGSLALLADAGHNLSELLGLLITWGASWLPNNTPRPSASTNTVKDFWMFQPLEQAHSPDLTHKFY